MSEFFELPNEDESQDEPETETDSPEFEADPSVIAFLDQEAAAFADMADEFESTYGFRHECHCDEDYTKGLIGEVTECYAGMIVESLETCARLNLENAALKDMLEKLIDLNTTLVAENNLNDEPAES